MKIIGIGILILIFLSLIGSCSDSNSSSSSYSYKYRHDAEYKSNVNSIVDDYDMSPAEVDRKIHAVDKAMDSQ